METFFPKDVDITFPPSPLPAAPAGQPLNEDGTNWIWEHTWPSHIVVFGALLKEAGVKETFVDKGYSVVWRSSNGFEEDPRRRGGVQVWKWVG